MESRSKGAEEARKRGTQSFTRRPSYWLPGLRGIRSACLALTVLLGCSPGPVEKPGDPVRLVYWPPPNRYDIEMTRLLVDDWNRRHPEIQVEMQPLPAGRSSEEVLLASIVGKTTPDICSNIA